MRHNIEITTIDALVLIAVLDGMTPQNEIDKACAERLRKNIEVVVIEDLPKGEKDVRQ